MNTNCKYAINVSYMLFIDHSFLHSVRLGQILTHLCLEGQYTFSLQLIWTFWNMTEGGGFPIFHLVLVLWTFFFFYVIKAIYFFLEALLLLIWCVDCLELLKLSKGLMVNEERTVPQMSSWLASWLCRIQICKHCRKRWDRGTVSGVNKGLFLK